MGGGWLPGWMVGAVGLWSRKKEDRERDPTRMHEAGGALRTSARPTSNLLLLLCSSV